MLHPCFSFSHRSSLESFLFPAALDSFTGTATAKGTGLHSCEFSSRSVRTHPFSLFHSHHTSLKGPSLRVVVVEVSYGRTAVGSAAKASSLSLNSVGVSVSINNGHSERAKSKLRPGQPPPPRRVPIIFEVLCNCYHHSSHGVIDLLVSSIHQK